MKPWPKGLQARMRVVRLKAEQRWPEFQHSMAVQELHGCWSVRTLDETARKEPLLEAASLEELERALP